MQGTPTGQPGCRGSHAGAGVSACLPSQKSGLLAGVVGIYPGKLVAEPRPEPLSQTQGPERRTCPPTQRALPLHLRLEAMGRGPAAPPRPGLASG